MSYHRPVTIEFGHCDPAGIVFYPRYFEMLNATIEQFCAEELGWSFAEIRAERGNGVPTVSVQVDFRAPSRVGERVVFTLEVLRIGGASVRFAITARGGDGIRLEAVLTLCWLEGGRPAPWPEALRSRLARHLRPRHEEDET